jgi:hypothetical protein
MSYHHPPLIENIVHLKKITKRNDIQKSIIMVVFLLVLQWLLRHMCVKRRLSGSGGGSVSFGLVLSPA